MTSLDLPWYVKTTAGLGNAGITLYTVGSYKYIRDIRDYISVDGGMTDNIRSSL